MCVTNSMVCHRIGVDSPIAGSSSVISDRTMYGPEDSESDSKSNLTLEEVASNFDVTFDELEIANEVLSTVDGCSPGSPIDNDYQLRINLISKELANMA